MTAARPAPAPNFTPPYWDPAAPGARYTMGKRVRVSAPSRPELSYAKGRVGVIERMCGHFRAPGQEDKTPYYRVRLALCDIWRDAPEKQLHATDTVDVDLPEADLEPFFDYSGDFNAESAKVAAGLKAPSPPEGLLEPPACARPSLEALRAAAQADAGLRANLLSNPQSLLGEFEIGAEALIALEDTPELRNFVIEPTGAPRASLRAPRLLPGVKEAQAVRLHDPAPQIRYLVLPC